MATRSSILAWKIPIAEPGRLQLMESQRSDVTKRWALTMEYAVLCCVYSLSRVRLFATTWTLALQAPLSMGILQARILVAMPSSRGSSQPRSPALHADSLLSKPPRNPMKTGDSSVSLFQGIFLTQEWTGVSCIAGRYFTSWATEEAYNGVWGVKVAQLCLPLCDSMDCSLPDSPLSTGFPRQEYWSGLLIPFPAMEYIQL